MKKSLRLLTVVTMSAAALAGLYNVAEKHHVAEIRSSYVVQAADYKEIEGEKLDKALEDDKKKEKYLVIDVRPEEEYKKGHVKWAIHIPVDEIENNLDLLKDYEKENVVTICNSGKKSAEAAQKLADAGFKKVFNAPGVKEYDYTTMTKVGYVLGATAQEMSDNNNGEYFFVDAREPKDFEKGRLPGALNVQVDELEDKLSEIPEDKIIVAYCYSGNRSNTIAQALSDKGYENVINATEGTKEWDGFQLTEK